MKKHLLLGLAVGLLAVKNLRRLPRRQPANEDCLTCAAPRWEHSDQQWAYCQEQLNRYPTHLQEINEEFRKIASRGGLVIFLRGAEA